MSGILHWEEESRFSRFSLISWWEQERIQTAKILVVGAGALGNEILKNLALLGAGRVAVVDMDRIEKSNLSRSPLFREKDIGAYKAEVACREARAILPELRAVPMIGNVVHQVGLGHFRWADLVLGGLDNREARLAISRACQLTHRPWIDGAIDVLAGLVRVFVPDQGACYECTLSESDWKIMDQRRACSLLPREAQAQEQRVPTTPTTASVIAGLQCSEALKLMHGMEGLRNAGFQFDGRGFDCYRVDYRRDPECFGHDVFEEILEMEDASFRSSLDDVLSRIRARWGDKVIVESVRELVRQLRCDACGNHREYWCSLDSLGPDQAGCPRCGAPCAPVVYHRLDGQEVPAGVSLAELGVPAFDILRVRLEDKLFGAELSRDGKDWMDDHFGGTT